MISKSSAEVHYKEETRKTTGFERSLRQTDIWTIIGFYISCIYPMILIEKYPLQNLWCYKRKFYRIYIILKKDASDLELKKKAKARRHAEA